MVEEANLMCPFSRLGMDSSFNQQAERMGLSNLNDMMNAKVSKLKRHKEFTFTWYAAMLNLLKEQDLLRRFQENQL